MVDNLVKELMDNIERAEIQTLIVKYQCQKDSQTVLDNLATNGKLNKASLYRKGLNEKNINACLTRLRLALADYKE